MIANKLLEVCEQRWSDSGNARSGFKSKSGGSPKASPDLVRTSKPHPHWARFVVIQNFPQRSLCEVRITVEAQVGAIRRDIARYCLNY
jgi:hypothetical protein